MCFEHSLDFPDASKLLPGNFIININPIDFPLNSLKIVLLLKPVNPSD